MLIVLKNFNIINLSIQIRIGIGSAYLKSLTTWLSNNTVSF